MRKIIMTSVMVSVITISEAKKGRCSWPVLAPKVKMSCSSNKPKPGTICSLSCPDGHKLAAPEQTTCECRGSNCNWTHGKYRPSCVIIVQGWGRDKANKPPGFRELSSFGSQINNDLPPIVEMDGDSKSIITTIRPKTLRPRTTTTVEPLNGGRNFDEEHDNSDNVESSALTCPELPVINQAALKCSNGRFDNSKCQYRCLTAGNTLEPHPRRSLRCQCDASTRVCVWENKLPENTQCTPVPEMYKCTDVLAPQNTHTQISCTNGILAGSVCTWKCENFFKLNKKGKSIRCKCKRDKSTKDDLNDFKCKWSNQAASIDEARFCSPKGGYFKNLGKQLKNLEKGDGNEDAIKELNDKIEDAKKWM